MYLKQIQDTYFTLEHNGIVHGPSMIGLDTEVPITKTTVLTDSQ